MKTMLEKTKMTRGRALVLCLALAATLVLGMTAASGAAEAKKIPVLKKGVTNLVQTVTTLGGFVSDDPVLRLDNDSSGGNATALDLQVEAGKAPMTVNSDARVDNLNADEIDGLDSTELVGEQGPQGPPGPEGPQGPPGSGLSPDDIYQVSAEAEGAGGGTLQNVRVDCDEGDKVLGGGGDPFDPLEDELRISGVLGQNQGWNVTMKDNGDADVVQADAICADFGEPHQD